MIVNLEWDAAALGAPQAFRNAIASAANILTATFVDPITLNISVGYGDVTENGAVIATPSSGMGLGGPAGGDVYNYSGLRGLLLQTADQTVTGALDLTPADALNGHHGLIAYSAQEKALGLIPATDSDLDGAIGFATDLAPTALIGAALHELAHAMGRVTDSQGATPGLFDLFRFTAPGQHLTGASDASSAYFSLDNGQTATAYYDQPSAPADFLGGTAQIVHDPFAASYGATAQTDQDPFSPTYGVSTLPNLTGLDIEQMQGLGFHLANSVPGLGAAFLGAGSASMAFRDAATGDFGVMSPTAGGETWRQVGPTSTDYMPVAFGDFNGDGVTDTAFRQTTTGDWGFMTANAGGGETWHAVGASSNAYAAVAVGDFNLDGRADILFRDVATGDMGFMSANPGGGETWHAVGPTSTDYQVVGAADFNKDGLLDVAFRDTATNDWGYMTVNPGGGETWHEMGNLHLTPVEGAPETLLYGYQVVGVGDFNGDGYPDIALRDPASGDLGYLTPNFTNTAMGGVAYTPSGPTSTAYVPVAVADYNGDGRPDIAFLDVDTGDLGYMSPGVRPDQLTGYGSIGHPQTWHPMGNTFTGYFAL